MTNNEKRLKRIHMFDQHAEAIRRGDLVLDPDTLNAIKEVNKLLNPTMTGAELRRRREALGLSLAALGKQLDIPRGTLWRWETERFPIEHGRLLDLALRYLESRP